MSTTSRPRSFMTLLAIATLLGQTACLKTRAQVRGENSAETPQEEGAEDSKGGGGRGSRYAMEELRSEITRLSGKLDDVEHQQRTAAASSNAENKELIGKLEIRIAEMEKNQLLIMTELKEIKDRGLSASASAGGTPSRGGLISEGNALLRQGRHADAAEKFQAALNRSPKGKEAAEAHYGLGEAEYGQKNYKKAIVSFSKVQDVHDKSHLIPLSLLRIGQSFQSLKMNKEARSFYNELVERYPKAPEAKKARSKLAGIGGSKSRD